MDNIRGYELRDGRSIRSGEAIIMSKSFTQLKDPKLQLTDKLTFGKLKDCRVCDVIEDHLEYLVWCEKQGFVKFSQDVKDVIKDQADNKGWQIEEESSQDDIRDLYEKVTRIDYDWEDDVPF